MNQPQRKIFTNLVRYAERQICSHEDTHRGGSNWEICSMCGMKWADDEGGKPKFELPKEITDAQNILSSLSEEKKTVTPYQQQLINWAILSLAESLSERDEVRAISNKVSRAKGYLEEFQNSLEPNEVELTEEESALSQYLHTMLRKGEDSGASAVLYRMVSQNQSSTVWKKFIKNAYASRPHFRFSLGEKAPNKFEDFTMHLLLHDWISDGSVRNYLKEVYK